MRYCNVNPLRAMTLTIFYTIVFPMLNMVPGSLNLTGNKRILADHRMREKKVDRPTKHFTKPIATTKELFLKSQ